MIKLQTSFMAENAEWLHFAQVIILSSPVHLSNLVSLDAQVQRRRVTTDFTLTLTLTLLSIGSSVHPLHPGLPPQFLLTKLNNNNCFNTINLQMSADCATRVRVRVKLVVTQRLCICTSNETKLLKWTGSLEQIGATQHSQP